MFSLRSVMALLAVLALSAKVSEGAMAAPNLCSEADVDIGFCSTCKTKAKCIAADLPPVSIGDCTVDGEACTVLAGIATCRPIDETACSCDKASQCDAYDPDSILICRSGGLKLSTDCSLIDKTCVNGACVTPVTTDSTVSPEEVCPGAPDGFVVITPLCTTAVYCLDSDLVNTTDECASGTYFDMDEMDCRPLPPLPCAGCGTGACPDKSDCSKLYICDVGEVLGEDTCEEAAPIFDIFTNECQAEGTCTGNVNCHFGLTSTAEITTTAVVSDSDGSSTGNGRDSTSSGSGNTGDSTKTTSHPSECPAGNVGQRYSYDGNCKMYWSCVQVGNGKYDYLESTCLGDLVFNTDTGYCDTPEKVPHCVLPS